jgi:hypothetical protein
MYTDPVFSMVRRQVGVCTYEGCGKPIYSVYSDYLPFCHKHNACQFCGKKNLWKPRLCLDCSFTRTRLARPACNTEGCTLIAFRGFANEPTTKCALHNVCATCGKVSGHKEALCFDCDPSFAKLNAK